MAIIGQFFVHNGFIVWHQTGRWFLVQELIWELNKVSINQSIINVLYVILGSRFRLEYILFELCPFNVNYYSILKLL